MGVRDTELADFRRSAISPSRLRLFCYCELAAVLERRAAEGPCLPIPAALRGFLEHEIQAKEHIALLGQLEPVEVWTVGEAMDFVRITIRRALEQRIMLANSNHIHTFCTIVPELVPGRGCYGYPDALDCRDGTSPMVVEAKYRASPLPGPARAADQIQCAAYMAGLVELGFTDAHARIAYRDACGRGGDVKLSYTAEVEAKLKAVARRFDSVERGLDEPISGDPRRCPFCRFKYVCACCDGPKSFAAPGHVVQGA